MVFNLLWGGKGHCQRWAKLVWQFQLEKSVVVVVVVSFMKKWIGLDCFCMRGHCCHCYILKFCICVHASSGGMQKLSKEWSLFVGFPNRRTHALDLFFGSPFGWALMGRIGRQFCKLLKFEWPFFFSFFFFFLGVVMTICQVWPQAHYFSIARTQFNSIATG